MHLFSSLYSLYLPFVCLGSIIAEKLSAILLRGLDQAKTNAEIINTPDLMLKLILDVSILVFSPACEQ